MQRGDFQAIGWTVVDIAKDELHGTRQGSMIFAFRRSGSGVEQGSGGHGRVGYVVSVGFQVLVLADIGCLASILAPAAIFSLRGDEPLGAFFDGEGDWIGFREGSGPAERE